MFGENVVWAFDAPHLHTLSYMQMQHQLPHSPHLHTLSYMQVQH